MEKIGETKKLSDCVNSCYLKEKKTIKQNISFQGASKRKQNYFGFSIHLARNIDHFVLHLSCTLKYQTKNPMAGKDLVIVCLHLVQKLSKIRILSRENLLIA